MCHGKRFRSDISYYSKCDHTSESENIVARLTTSCVRKHDYSIPKNAMKASYPIYTLIRMKQLFKNLHFEIFCDGSDPGEVSLRVVRLPEGEGHYGVNGK